MPGMSTEVVLQIVKIIPSALWVCFALIVFLLLRRVISEKLQGAASISGPAGISVSFQEAVNQVLVSSAGPAVDAGDRNAVASRLSHAVEFMRGRLLWVDDKPESHAAFNRLFEKAGMTVVDVRSTQEAIVELGRRHYDLVITDKHRDTEQPAGTAWRTLLDEMARRSDATPVVGFTGAYLPEMAASPQIFGQSIRLDDLVNLVIDVMERRHFGTAFDMRAEYDAAQLPRPR